MCRGSTVRSSRHSAGQRRCGCACRRRLYTGLCRRDAETAALVIEQALVLNPNLAIAWYSGAWMKIWLGKPKSAIDDLSYAMRLSPLDPNMIFTQVGTAHAHFFAGRYDEACSWAERVLSEWESGGHAALRIATASHALAGRVEQARKFCARLQQRDPALRVSNLRNVL